MNYVIGGEETDEQFVNRILKENKTYKKYSSKTDETDIFNKEGTISVTNRMRKERYKKYAERGFKMRLDYNLTENVNLKLH
jgi:hypothetical protein